MYAAFNLINVRDVFNNGVPMNTYAEYYKVLNDMEISATRSSLSKYLLNDVIIDGKLMSEDWFPQIKADVFLSHSHLDKEYAYAIAGWLNVNFGLKVFVDSAIWGCADELLSEIDNKYCMTGRGYYSYVNRNISTAHIHMMLSTALLKMIDETECLFFLNTENSLTTQLSNCINGSTTYSPWIYSEIAIANCIRRERKREGVIFESARDSAEIRKYIAVYPIELEGFPIITSTLLDNWRRSKVKDTRKIHSLDILYGIVLGKWGDHYGVQ